MRVSPTHRLLLLWIALIVYGSFFPFTFRLRLPPDHILPAILHTWPRRLDRFVVRDFFVNVTLYVPLGIFWWLGRDRRKWTRAVVPIVGGLLLSCLVEVFQYFTRTRTASLFDVACNTAGSGLGVLIAALANRRLQQLKMRAVASGVFRPSANLLLLGCWVGYQIAPLFPALSRTKVMAKIAFLGSAASMSTVTTAVACTEWLAVAWVLSEMAAIRQSWLYALLLLMPVRLFLEGRMLSMGELAGAVLAVAAWSLVLGRLAGRTRIIAGAVIVGIVIDGLRPFHMSSQPSVFWWVPFSGSLMADREFGLPELLRKTFVYGAAIWLLAESGIALSISAVAVAGVLGALEAAQRYLPGRTAEITDPLLALGMAYALSLAGRARVRSKLV